MKALTNKRYFFDDVLPSLTTAIIATLGEEALEKGVVLRDASGLVKFVAATPSTSINDRESVELQLATAAGAYARQDGILLFENEVGARRLLSDPIALPAHTDTCTFRLIDRRIVGSSWLDLPSEIPAFPPRIVFASLKGGVGRSTALSVTAADLAKRNKNILVIDLDIEAPGLGDLLLDEERLPPFGVIDYLVENGINHITDRELSDFVGTSTLTASSGGRVDVLPAIGHRSAAHPGNTLAKLARAIIEDIDSKGVAIPFSKKVATMVDRFGRMNSYDVVLIDSRAGLSELAAPAILGLGATILLFGTAQKQTIQGYEALFAALKMLAERDRQTGASADWRLMLKAVYAKASLDETVAERYIDDLYDLFAENLYDEDGEGEGPTDLINFDIDDPAAPHQPLIIPFTQAFVDFDPVFANTQLAASFYEQTYRHFLNGIDALLTNAVPENIA